MDSKIVRRGIAVILLAIVAVFALVYLTNADFFRSRPSGSPSGTSATEAPSGSGQSAYGMQIGDNLKAFLTDPDFFDPVGETPETYSEEDVIAVTPRITAESGLITIRIVDAQDRVVTGESFTIVLKRLRQQNTRNTEMTFSDSDRDGTIRIEGLSAGVWGMTFHAIEGYRVPTEEIQITVEGSAAQEEATDSADSADTAEEDGAGTGASSAEEDADTSAETDTSGAADTESENGTN